MNRVLGTNMLNWAERISWGWWDDWNNTFLQTNYSKFDPWRSEAEHANSRSQRLLTVLNLYELAGKKRYFCFFETWMPERGTNLRSPTSQACCSNHCTRAPALINSKQLLKKLNCYTGWTVTVIMTKHYIFFSHNKGFFSAGTVFRRI